jgi:hypothetical protein
MDYHFYNLILFVVWCVYDLKKKLQKVLSLWVNVLSEYKYLVIYQTHTVQATEFMQHFSSLVTVTYIHTRGKSLAAKCLSLCIYIKKICQVLR